MKTTTKILTVIFTLTIFTQTSLANFKDVKSSDWFSGPISKLAELGVVNGYKGEREGEFGPADYVTDEQIAKMVLESAMKSGLIETIPNKDGAWYEKYTSYFNQNGYQEINGDISIGTKSTRGEVARYILIAKGYEAPEVSGEYFKDVSVHTRHAKYIEEAYRRGIVNGYKDESGNLNGNFGANNLILRAEVSKMIYNAFFNEEGLVKNTEKFDEKEVIVAVDKSDDSKVGQEVDGGISGKTANGASAAVGGTIGGNDDRTEAEKFYETVILRENGLEGLELFDGTGIVHIYLEQDSNGNVIQDWYVNNEYDSSKVYRVK